MYYMCVCVRFFSSQVFSGLLFYVEEVLAVSVWFSVLWIFCLSCCIHFGGFEVVEWEVHWGSGWFK